MKIYLKNITRNTESYIGRKNNFVFTLAKKKDEKWYFYCMHKTLDIRFNSLWEQKEYLSLEDCKKACESFKPSNYSCCGKDIPL